jgi:uncharacterized protein (DUF849 family)
MNSSVAGQPLIIEASLNGSTPKARNPSVPYSDDEIVEQAVACMAAGAALIHNHTSEPIIGGSGVMDAQLYAGAWRKLLALRPDAILTPTMAVGQEGVSVETRYAHVVQLAEQGIIAQGLCDPGTFNLGMLDQEGLFAPGTYLYKNDMHDSRYYVETCRQLNIGLSISVFEPSFVRFIMAYVRAGKMPAGGLVKFYFAAADLPFGLLPTARSLEAYLELIEGSNLPWLVSSFGEDCVGCGIAEEAIKRGGHVQVGLEPFADPANRRSRVPSNLELVEEVVQLAKKYDRPIATPAQAAKILNLPTHPVAFRQA